MSVLQEFPHNLRDKTVVVNTVRPLGMNNEDGYIEGVFLGVVVWGVTRFFLLQGAEGHNPVHINVDHIVSIWERK